MFGGTTTTPPRAPRSQRTDPQRTNSSADDPQLEPATSDPATSEPATSETAASEPATSEPPADQSLLRLLWRTPFLRSACIGLFIAGIGVSSTMPQMTLFLVDELHLSTSVAGLYYLVNLVAPISGFIVGSLSDRLRNRLFLYRCCALLAAIGWVGMSLATQPWQPFVIGAVALSLGGGSMGQLFAATRDELSRHPSPMNNRVVAAIRMAFSAGWIVGPVVGSWFGAAFGLRPLLLATAICAFGQVVPLGFQRVERYVHPSAPIAPLPHPRTTEPRTTEPRTAEPWTTEPGTTEPGTAEPRTESGIVEPGTGSETNKSRDSEETGSDRAPTRRPRHTEASGFAEKVPLLVFLGCCVLVMNGDTMKFAYLPLYMENDLKLSDELRGAVIAIQPFLELLLMPLAARLADRFTPLRVLAAASVLGVGAHLCYATSTQALGLFAGQILMSGVWATSAGLGITVAQQLYPQRVGLASSMYGSVIPLAGALGGSLGAFGVTTLGIPHVFFIPATLTVLGFVGMILTARRYRPDDSAFAIAEAV